MFSRLLSSVENEEDETQVRVPHRCTGGEAPYMAQKMVGSCPFLGSSQLL